MVDRLPLLRPDCTFANRWGVGSENVNLDYLTDEYIRKNFSSAGVLPLSSDGQKILLGAHKVEGELLWGPFAGKRELGEGPEETAERELGEELGVIAKLRPPTILINMTSGKSKIGVVYPTILDDVEFSKVPNKEISTVKWFDWGELAKLQDVYSDPCYLLWGDLYTWMLLDNWSYARYEAEKEGVHTILKMHRVHILFATGIGFGFSETPYKILKRKDS